MFKWSPFPFVRYTIYLIVGILLYTRYPDAQAFIVLAIASGLLLFHSRFSDTLGGLIGAIALVSLGFFAAQRFDETKKSKHYSRYDLASVKAYSGLVVSPPLEREKYHRYTLRISEILTDSGLVSSTGQIHMYVREGRDSMQLQYGDLLQVKGRVSSIPAPLNPQEFNYSRYVARMNIHGQSFVHAAEIRVMDSGYGSQIMGYAFRIREFSIDLINAFVPEERERSIALALIIGVKDYLSDEVKIAYSSAGAMHVLAVSGLHMGIIYGVLAFLFSKLKTRNGRWFYLIIILVGLWLYACITGLSPSVMRAATMFSVFAISDTILRSTNVYNSLGLAAFVLLLVRPDFLYSVGFQLSFIAVIGIVYIYPMLFRLYSFDNRVVRFIWSITCISVAAQLATFPLTVYYFHQFPTFFFISNLFVIPGAFVILSVGLSMIILGALMPIVGVWLGKVLSWIIYAVNEVVLWVDSLPGSLIQWLYLSSVEVILVYSFIIFALLAWQYRSISTMMSSLLILLTLQVSWWARYFDSLEQSHLMIYEIRDQTCIDLVRGREANLLVSGFRSEELELLGFQINPYRLSAGLPPIVEKIKSWDDSKPMMTFGGYSVLVWNHQRMVIVDGDLDISLKQPIACDYLLVTKGARLSLAEMRKLFNFKQLIVSADVDHWYARDLEKEAVELSISLHDIRSEGYWQSP